MTVAAAGGATVMVKIDGDGQMDPALIRRFVGPILRGEADYTKGNRFVAPDHLQGMPAVRVFGNGVLSFFNKLASGYWTIFDPTNGYVAIHSSIFALLPERKLARRFFFESDLLFRLNLVRAHVLDIPMRASYADEKSNLSARRMILPFMWYTLRNFGKRIVYSYFVRDFSVGSIYLLFGLPLLIFGLAFGGGEWVLHWRSGELASAGTVMLAALPIIVGFQLVLAFLTYDVSSVPRVPIHPRLVEA